MKAGNAAGGKETTYGSAVQRHTSRPRKRGNGVNKTAPHSRESPQRTFVQIHQPLPPDERRTLEGVLSATKEKFRRFIWVITVR